jgi:hypothetical protein
MVFTICSLLGETCEPKSADDPKDGVDDDGVDGVDDGVDTLHHGLKSLDFSYLHALPTLGGHPSPPCRSS